MTSGPEFPMQLSYVLPAARRYGVVEIAFFDTKWSESGGKLPLAEADMRVLADTYAQIVHREDAQPLFRWLDDSSPMAPDHCELRMLMMLYRRLGQQGFAPFRRRSLESVVRLYPKPDWTKLPTDLQYIGEPAEVYGVIQFEDDVEAFCKAVKPAERQWLHRFWHDVNRDIVDIVDWLSRHSEHREADLVHFMLLMLSELCGF